MSRASLAAVCLGEQPLSVSLQVLNISASVHCNLAAVSLGISFLCKQLHPLHVHLTQSSLCDLVCYYVKLPLPEPQCSSCPLLAGPSPTDQRTRNQSKVDIIPVRPVISCAVVVHWHMNFFFLITFLGHTFEYDSMCHLKWYFKMP